MTNTTKNNSISGCFRKSLDYLLDEFWAEIQVETFTWNSDASLKDQAQSKIRLLTSFNAKARAVIKAAEEIALLVTGHESEQDLKDLNSTKKSLISVVFDNDIHIKMLKFLAEEKKETEESKKDENLGVLVQDALPSNVGNASGGRRYKDPKRR